MIFAVFLFQTLSTNGNGSTMSDDQVFEEEDDPCLICMDELDAGAMTKLGCAHRFHTEVRYFNDIVV